MRNHKRIKDGQQVTKILKKNGCEIRNGRGSHRVAKLPDGKVLTYHEHGEYGPGIRCKIEKALMAAGLLLFIGLVAYVALSGSI